MKILVQGFGPFSRFAVNPSELLVRALRDRQPARGDLRAEVLETTAANVAEAVPALMEDVRPDVWIGVGLAAGRPALSVEAVAVNIGCWQTGDPEADPQAGGEPWPRHPVAAGGAAAYLTTLPAGEILGAWRDAEIPGYLSNTAGTYLCNMSFYLAAQAAERLGTGCLVGFVHVPLLPAQVTKPASEPSMSFALQQAGLDVVLDTCRASGRTGGPVSTGRTG
ncbi:MAG TPA: pyroglutamyl-peptidase I [Streptosporangiaceae bacterium]|jgi:pyroglutamyl-peptidase